MSKIMLVEDDNNLREIYEARLLAEGYEIVSAHDGEEALALAVKEKPDLIISDVMMPKISGFDMLDILRSTPETRDTKVIMMTALSQAEDKARADKLGADRYLVKSQVTLEDVVKIAREVMEGPGAAGAAPTPSADPVATPAASPAPEPTAGPVVAAPVVAPVVAAPVATPPADPVATPTPAPVTDTPIPVTSTLDSVENAQSSSDEQSAVTDQVTSFVNQNPGTDVTPATTAPIATATEPVSGPAPEPETSETKPAGGVNGKKVLQPISAPETKPDLNELLAKEEAKNAAPAAPATDDPNLISL
jgi:CheY-like chemotaxis protein